MTPESIEFPDVGANLTEEGHWQAPLDRAAHARRVQECFEANHQRIIRWLEVRIGSLAVARDIANETFVRLLELKQPVRDLTPYAYKVASYVLAQRREVEAIHRRLDVRLVGEGVTDSPEPEAVAEDLSRALKKALDALPPRIREAVRLRFWEELQYAEIVERFRAKGIEVTLRTVVRWVAHGLELCRTAVAEGGNKE